MREKEREEKRKVFRIRVAGSLLDAEVGCVPACSLVDANSEGFAIIARASFRVGAVVQIRLCYNGQTFSGRARIRNVTTLENGKYRYGLQTAEGEQGLRKGLRLIAISAQRKRLRRLAARKTLRG